MIRRADDDAGLVYCYPDVEEPVEILLTLTCDGSKTAALRLWIEDYFAGRFKVGHVLTFDVRPHRDLSSLGYVRLGAGECSDDVPRGTVSE